jgi:hypothetical protein
MAPFVRSLLLIAFSMSQANAGEPEIWLAPLDPIERPFNGTKGSADYFDLFLPGAPWVVSAKHIKVFKIYPQLVAYGSDEDLARMFQSLKQRHIALALEFGAMTDTEVCGRGVEGYNGEALGRMAERIKHLDGDIRYFAMDEPLWYGVHFNGKNGCHSKVEAVARDIAVNIERLKVVYPNVQVGDIEPMPVAQVPGWKAEIINWTKAFEGATGEKLAFLHADVLWDQPWQPFLTALDDELHANDILFGVIYNGNSGDMSDAAWIRHAEQHFRTFETDRRRPDQAIFQSWVNYPTRVLPETAPESLTYLVRLYVLRHGEQ